jgi:uncharacterized protein YndB with AHSA1/START domain
MKKLSCYFMLSFLFCFNLQAKVIHVTDHGFIVENSFTTEQSSEKVWLALVNNIDKWWPKDHSWWSEQGTFSIDAKAGGCFCEVAGDRSAEHMHISYVEPHKLLRMTGGLGPLQSMGVYGSLDWTFSEVDGKTKITLTYSVTGINQYGFEKLAPIVARVQGNQLNGLKQFVEK